MLIFDGVKDVLEASLCSNRPEAILYYVNKVIVNAIG